MKVTHVNLKLTLKTDEEKLSAKCELELRNAKKLIPFFLNKQLKINNIKVIDQSEVSNLVPIMKEVPNDSFLKTCNLWELEYSTSNSMIILQFEYEGMIESDLWGTNYLTKDAVELGIYVGYYPIVGLDDKPSFKLQLTGSTNWKWLVNAPKVEDTKSLVWETDESRIDLYLIGLPSEITIQEESVFWGRKKNFGIYESLSNDLKGLERDLRNWLREMPAKDFHLALVPRTTGGLISRNGLIAMQDNLEEEVIKKNYQALLFSWTHEIGHFWFSKTDVSSYHNWIDEALCDFCALLVTKEKFGNTFYKEKLNRIKTLLSEVEEPLPAIMSIERSHTKADLLFYKYGNLILVNIMEQIGEELMRKVITNFAQKCVNSDKITTEDFLVSLQEVTSNDWSAFLYDKLSKPPVLAIVREEEE